MDTANGINLGCNWQGMYFIQYCFDLDLKFEGSQKDREKQFEDYIIPLVMPFAKEYGLGDYDDPAEEDLRGYVRWLEGDFTDCDTLSQWCEKRGYKALCYWDLACNEGELLDQLPVWLN